MSVSIPARTGLCLLTAISFASAQEVTAPPPAPTVEPGLEEAVKWPWKAAPSDPAVWGRFAATEPETPAPAVPAAPAPGTPAAPAAPTTPKATAPEQALDHTVAKGESLTLIARRYHITLDQLRLFNSLKSDMIQVGQVLRIPGIADLKALMAAAPPKTAAEPGKAAPRPRTPDPAPTVLIAKKPRRALPPAAWGAASLVQTQAFLDRQGFTIGPIDGTTGPIYEAAFRACEQARPGLLFTPDGQPSDAMKAMGGAYTEYELRPDDLRWISDTPEPPRKKDTPPPVITFADLTKETFLAYRSGWEFVAERFHASEAFLRRINPHIRSPNTPGTTYLVPNVVPFEIEKALAEPLQPAADPAVPVRATIVELKRLVIRRGEEVIASMPVSVARPGLRGRGTWKILDAIPRPQLVSSGSITSPLPAPAVLPPGPNNPVGFAWINLAKAADTAPLPYGLHGTSIPGHMMKQESLGGFRLTNWDLARALRLLPAGTELTWE
ncbi:MAG: LysM peptidoglycan-binding domain-containing protein [Verrucomicrobiaceae bacterium]|nr:LysM peptidoglycan-binding domain-containing protein [Verrucomicrobiaceae bacterium]